MKKGNKKNTIIIVVSSIIVIILLSLVGVSLYKVNTIENDSIPEVLDEIDNNKKNTTALADSLTGKINDFEGKTSEELASIIKNQKNYYSATNKNIDSKFESLKSYL